MRRIEEVVEEVFQVFQRAFNSPPSTPEKRDDSQMRHFSTINNNLSRGASSRPGFGDPREISDALNEVPELMNQPDATMTAIDDIPISPDEQADILNNSIISSEPDMSWESALRYQSDRCCQIFGNDMDAIGVEATELYLAEWIRDGLPSSPSIDTGSLQQQLMPST